MNTITSQSSLAGLFREVSEAGTISPSQASMYAECPRKWAWRYLDGIKEPQRASAKVGERVHKIIEDYLEFGTPPDTTEQFSVENERGETKIYYPGLIAYHGLHVQPPPSPHLDIEVAFEHGHWNGRLDLAFEEIPETRQIVPFVDGPQAPGAIAVVQDQKTSTDPFTWGKGEDELREDVQALVYADAALAASGADVVELRWVYHQTRHPYRLRPTVFRMTRAEVAENKAPWDVLAENLVRTKRAWQESHVPEGQRALHFTPNPNACQMFGGCFHVGRCQLKPEEIIRGFFMQEASFLDKVKAAKELKSKGQAQPSINSAMSTIPEVSSEPEPTDWVPNQNDPTGQWLWSPSTGKQKQVSAPTPVATPTPETTPAAQGRGVTEADLPTIRQLFVEQNMDSVAIATQLGIAEVSMAAVMQTYGGPWSVERNARRASPNPPEEPSTPITSPEQAGPAGDDESKAGDQFDSMDKPQLLAFNTLHNLGLEVKRLGDKKIRVLVRNAWKDRQTQMTNPTLAASTLASQKTVSAPSQPPTPPHPTVTAGPPQPPAPATAPVPPAPPVQMPPPAPAPPQPPAPAPAPAAPPVAPMPPPAPAPEPPLAPAATSVAPMPPASMAPPVPPTAAPGPLVVSPPTPPAAVPPAPLAPPSESGESFRLFVDCVPRRARGNVMSVRQAFAPAFEEAAKGEGANGLDYRLVSFGKGPGMLAAAVAQLQRVRPLGGDVVVTISSSSSEGQALVEMLTDLASEVVYGV